MGWDGCQCLSAHSSLRALFSIEDYLCKEVLPLYANTHTGTAHLSRQTTHFREEARYDRVLESFLWMAAFLSLPNPPSLGILSGVQLMPQSLMLCYLLVVGVPELCTSSFMFSTSPPYHPLLYVFTLLVDFCCFPLPLLSLLYLLLFFPSSSSSSSSSSSPCYRLCLWVPLSTTLTCYLGGS